MRNKHNSTESAGKLKRLDVIALAAHKAAYKAAGGEIERVGTTKSVELGLTHHHNLAVMRGYQWN